MLNPLFYAMEPEICHLSVYIPYRNQYPLKTALEKVRQKYLRIRRTGAGLGKSASTFKKFKRNISEPSVKGYARMLNPEFVSRSELSADEILSQRDDKMHSKETFEKYKKGVKEMCRIKDENELKEEAVEYADEMTRGDWRLEGPLSPDGAGPVSALDIALDCLCGKKKIVKQLREQDKFQGRIVRVVWPAKAGEFKIKFRALLKRGFKHIIRTHYDPAAVDKQNDRLKQLADCYVCPEFVVSLNWTVIPDSGHPDKPAYFDMNLDVRIRVSKR